MACTFTVILAFASFAGFAAAAEKKVRMEDLPPAVRKTVQDQTEEARIRNIIRETEKGQVRYEVESMVNGKSRDFIVDAKGALVEVEEEVAIDSIPTPAKAAIQKKAAGGKITRVETLTRGASTSYEASYTTRAGKKASVGVIADGSEVK